jgi:hypothetical protein
VDIQQAGPSRLTELGHQVGAPPLAHVDHTLEHALNVAYRRRAFLSPVPDRTEDLPNHRTAAPTTRGSTSLGT